MYFDANNPITFKTNKDALIHFGIDFQRGRTDCYFDYPGHEGEYAIWFNYPSKRSKGGKPYNPSTSKYINNYYENNSIIEVLIPNGKRRREKGTSIKIINFAKHSKTNIQFTGVYVLASYKEKNRTEVFKRISTCIDTNELHYCIPAEYYEEYKEKYPYIYNDDDIENDEDESVNRLLEQTSYPKYNKGYIPSKEEILSYRNKVVYKRHKEPAENALYNSGMKCEFNKKHHLFVKKNGAEYLEIHHLIPMKAQKEIKESIDCEENIVCLCPNCHREIHYGKDRNSMIKKIYKQRKDRLKKVQIDIDVEWILEQY